MSPQKSQHASFLERIVGSQSFSPRRRRFFDDARKAAQGGFVAALLLEAKKAYATNYSNLTDILNDATLTHDSPTYDVAIGKWEDSVPIWSQLNSSESKIRFLRYILDKDSHNTQTYVYDTDDENYKTNYPGKPIDPKNPYVCRHFSRKMYYVYRQDTAQYKHTPTHDRYKFSRAVPKYHIPIREVEVTFTPSSVNKRSHLINAVYLGGSDRSSSNWFFFDPGDDSILFRSPTYSWNEFGTIFTIYPGS